MAITLAALVCSCSPTRKADRIRNEGITAVVSIPNENQLRVSQSVVRIGTVEKVADAQGREALLMKAAMDENGEMIASDEIEPAIKIENFRNVAERGGGVDLKFSITAPRSMIDSRWQVRFTPFLLYGKDTLELDRFFITGEEYRNRQIQANRRYERYLNSIETDSAAFVHQRELNIFLQRLETVSNDAMPVIVDHYTDNFRKSINERRFDRRDEVFRRMVSSPILTDALRLDTVITSDNGDMVYEYVQHFVSQANLRKVELVLTGGIFDIENSCMLSLQDCGPLTYYISSLSTLAVFPESRKSDSLYVSGYELLMERKYREAITVLSQYGDFNSALAHCALGYDEKALSIVRNLPSCARVEYLKAILFSRKEDDFAAYQAYSRACLEDRNFVHRGNLDPEICRIKKKYNFNL